MVVSGVDGTAQEKEGEDEGMMHSLHRRKRVRMRVDLTL